MIATAGGASGRLRRRNRILKLRAEGLSFDEIAARVGVTNGTISYYLEKYGETRAKAKRKRMGPIVLGSTVNGSNKGESGNGPTLNDASLLDLLWARLTVEEKVKVIKVLEGKGD